MTKLVLIKLKGTRGFFSLSFLGKWTKTLKYRLRVLDPVFLMGQNISELGGPRYQSHLSRGKRRLSRNLRNDIGFVFAK